MENTDVAIIGAGPGGYVAALYAAQNGARVTLIEKSHVGGTCLNRGCIPTKSLVVASKIFRECKMAERYGIDIKGNVDYDWSRVAARMNNVSSTVRKGVEALISNRKINYLQGAATFLNNKTLRVNNDNQISAKHIVIATGSSAAKPAHFDFDGIHIATSDDFLHWDSLPADICIVGEGIIACELAFVLESFGVKVVMIGMESRPLPMLDHDVSVVIQREMKKRKIRFIANTRVEQIIRKGERVTIQNERAEVIIESERALVCVGRTPNTTGSELGNTSIQLSPTGSIMVDEKCQTTVNNIYAIGDVNANCMLAHSASRQAKLAINTILNIPDPGIDYACIPWSIFTDPEVAVVGKSAAQAIEEGFNIETGRFDIRGIGKAQVLGELSGIIKVIVDRQSSLILGVHIVGPHATELIQHAGLAVKNHSTVAQLLDQVYSHPTVSEAVFEALEDAHTQAIHKPLKT